VAKAWRFIAGVQQWRTEEGWGVQTLLMKFRSFDKAEPNSQLRGKLLLLLFLLLFNCNWVDTLWQ
jgi:hypothetical protein